MPRITIEITVPRPFLTLTIVSVVVLLWSPHAVSEAAMGGRSRRGTAVLERMAERQWVERRVLAQREEILQAQLRALDAQLQGISDDLHSRHFLEEARREVLTVARDRREAEHRLKESLQQLWAAQEIAGRSTIPNSPLPTPNFRLHWPLRPTEGISASFHDPSYEQRFGLMHEAIDIPAPQDSPVRAAAAGTVIAAEDNGLGFSSVTLAHDSGLTTLYGHVSEIFVEEGEEVRAGETIAKSGGMPGTPGAGWLSTGPHVHFEVAVEGRAVDPLQYLPDRGMLIASRASQ